MTIKGLRKSNVITAAVFRLRNPNSKRPTADIIDKLNPPLKVKVLTRCNPTGHFDFD